MRNCAIIHPLHLELETIPSGLRDEQVLFLSDIFPTGYMGAENCGMERGDTVAVWGCGPVGQFAIQSAWMLGAGRVIAIDRVPARLRMAEKDGKAETVNFENEGVYVRLKEMTKWTRTGPLHRCCRDRGPCGRQLRCRTRQGQGRRLSWDRQAACAP